MFKRIDHIEITPSNYQESLKFYQNILQFEILKEVEVNNPPLLKVVFLTLGNTKLELLKFEETRQNESSKQDVGYRMMGLEVEDMDEAIQYLENKNVDITWGPVDVGGTKRAEFQDPDGLNIELREWS